jgi:hypothetical protein
VHGQSVSFRKLVGFPYFPNGVYPSSGPIMGVFQADQSGGCKVMVMGSDSILDLRGI